MKGAVGNARRRGMKTIFSSYQRGYASSSSSSEALRQFFGWIESRYGGKLPMDRGGSWGEVIVSEDGCLQIQEAELLRAISDSLGCPMPPLSIELEEAA